eukprot:TRINITY_DN15799_c0_g1_i1.p1 TRINITY_DN15799_c0_g1~~TRINITY_DN15799_c0_g1_i1.p1  ORF type:complete len:724 (+),score=109.23 TRINITY_DN15799_c0_g1_i1:119-2290(+)
MDGATSFAVAFERDDAAAMHDLLRRPALSGLAARLLDNFGDRWVDHLEGLEVRVRVKERSLRSVGPSEFDGLESWPGDPAGAFLSMSSSSAELIGTEFDGKAAACGFEAGGEAVLQNLKRRTVDCQSCTSSDSRAEPTMEENVAKAAALVFRAGDEVVIQNLQKRPELNGSPAKLLGKAGDRWAVAVGSLDVGIKLKEVNFHHLHPVQERQDGGASAQEASHPSGGRTLAFEEGDDVVIQNLQKRPELNGSPAKLLGKAGDRWAVAVRTLDVPIKLQEANFRHQSSVQERQDGGTAAQEASDSSGEAPSGTKKDAALSATLQSSQVIDPEGHAAGTLTGLLGASSTASPANRTVHAAGTVSSTSGACTGATAAETGSGAGCTSSVGKEAQQGKQHTSMSFERGDEVVVQNLVQKPELNGLRVRLRDKQGDRWAVDVDGQALRIKIKEVNFVHLYCIQPDLESAQRADALWPEIRANYAASLGVAESRPTCLSPALVKAVVADFPACYQGQFMSGTSSDGRRFLSCLGVLVCIAVFAWMPGPNPRGFVSHINSHVLSNGKDALAEMEAGLLRAFAGVKLSDVRVHILGGHRLADVLSPLVLRHSRDSPKSAFSWHIKDMLKRLGFVNINTDMLLAFDGFADQSFYRNPLKTPTARENKRFVVAALDLHTGSIITHTKSPGGFARGVIGPAFEAIQKEFDREASFTHRSGVFCRMQSAPPLGEPS